MVVRCQDRPSGSLDEGIVFLDGSVMTRTNRKSEKKKLGPIIESRCILFRMYIISFFFALYFFFFLSSSILSFLKLSDDV